jgi:hypothetical protein
MGPTHHSQLSKEIERVDCVLQAYHSLSLSLSLSLSASRIPTMLRFLAATTKAADTQKTIASTLRPSGLSLEVKLLLLLLLLLLQFFTVVESFQVLLCLCLVPW